MLIVDGISEEVENFDRDFPFPNHQSPLFLSRKTIIENGQVVGAGLVRLTAEGILILDSEQPRTIRAKAAAAVIAALKQDVKNKGLDECHVFVRDPNVQRFLEHLGFRESRGGKALIIHF